MGYIPKTSSEEILADALRAIFGGGVYLPRTVLGQQPWSAPQPPASDSSNAPLPPKSPLRPVDLGLTPRETDVLRLLIEGKPNKTIGRELNIAESTVKAHAQAACRKLNVTRRTEAIVAVARTGLILAREMNSSISQVSTSYTDLQGLPARLSGNRLNAEDAN
jgi:DNA-binding NarL/FixJ family response regulator